MASRRFGWRGPSALGLRGRGEPSVNLCAEGFTGREFSVLRWNAIDVLLGEWPHRVVVGDHIRDEVFEFAVR